MLRKQFGGGKTAFRLSRLVVQSAALVLAVLGLSGMFRGLGLPPTAFTALVVLGGVFYCGWVCPFGTAQEWLRHIGKNVVGVTLSLPARIDRFLLLGRYALFLLAVLLLVRVVDPRHGFAGFLAGETVEIAGYAAAGIMLALALFTDRPFCRYFCGFGAKYGLLSVFRVFAVKRDAGTCVGCGKCDRSCQMGVPVSSLPSVRDAHCINCFECVAACPVQGALKTGFTLPGMADVRAWTGKYRFGGEPVSKTAAQSAQGGEGHCG